jgi:riboflavin transporter FmnP
MNGKTRKLAVMAMLVAISIVMVYLIHIPLIPAVSFLEYDPADIPILIGAFAYGPVAGILLTVVTSVIQGLTVSAGSGLYGILMHIIATSVLVLVASGIYRTRHTKKGAIVGLVIGSLAMAAVMLPANHFITPAFMGVPTDVLDALLLPGILPFNLIKAGINSVITFLVYKTVSRHLIHGESWKKHGKKSEAPLTATGAEK